MKKEASENYRALTELQKAIYDFSVRCNEDLPKNIRIADIVDIAFAMKKCSELADDMRKCCNAVVQHFSRLICLASGELSVTKVVPIRSEHVTATPQVKMMRGLPSKRKEPEEWANLLKYFGVSQELLDTGIVKESYNGMIDFITKQLGEGKNLPPELQNRKEYAIYSCRFRQNKPFEDKPNC